jgi:hypothetical protein
LLIETMKGDTQLKKLICISSAMLVAAAAAFGQSSGSGGGSFANAFLVPVIACSAGTFGTNCTSTGGAQSGILFSNIQVPASKNVLLLASLETSLLTNTQVASSNGNKSTATASGAVVVTPHLFPCTGSGTTPCSTLGPEVANAVTPSVVTFNQRQQTLSANLLGLNCTADPTTGVVTCTSPETIDLILSTTSANSFNFFVSTPGQGTYQIQLVIGLSATASSDSIQAGAQATVGVGAGSMVNLVVQQETPNTSLTLCKGTSGPSFGQSCGP